MSLYADIKIYDTETDNYEFKCKGQRVDIALSDAIQFVKYKYNNKPLHIFIKTLKKIDEDLIGIAEDIGKFVGFKK